MSKKILNQKADILNKNKGTSGTNITYDKAQGNRGKQLNKAPNNSNTKIKKAGK